MWPRLSELSGTESKIAIGVAPGTRRPRDTAGSNRKHPVGSWGGSLLPRATIWSHRSSVLGLGRRSIDHSRAWGKKCEAGSRYLLECLLVFPFRNGGIEYVSATSAPGDNNSLKPEDDSCVGYRICLAAWPTDKRPGLMVKFEDFGLSWRRPQGNSWTGIAWGNLPNIGAETGWFS